MEQYVNKCFQIKLDGWEECGMWVKNQNEWPGL